MTLEEFKVMQKADKYAWKDMKTFMDAVVGYSLYNTDNDEMEEFIAKQLINAYMEGYRKAKLEMEEKK